MSQDKEEVALIALVKVAPGKWDRLDELFADSLDYAQKNEPGTLEFRVFRATEGDSSRGMLVERYASQDALARHRSSEKYQNFFKGLTAESIFEGPPEMITGAYKYGFWRS